MFHWPYPDLSTRELQISPCLQRLPKKLLQNTFQRFGLAKETAGGILPGPFPWEPGEPLPPTHPSEASQGDPKPPHTNSKADPFFSAILSSRVPGLSRLHFQTPEADLKSSQGKLFRFLWLLLTPHDEIFLHEVFSFRGVFHPFMSMWTNQRSPKAADFPTLSPITTVSNLRPRGVDGTLEITPTHHCQPSHHLQRSFFLCHCIEPQGRSNNTSDSS